MNTSDLPQLNLEAIFGLAGSLVAAIVWLIRLEQGVRAAKEKQVELARDIEKVDLRVEKLEARHDAVNNEVRSMLLGIQSSISNIEGRLYISSRDRERNKE